MAFLSPIVLKQRLFLSVHRNRLGRILSQVPTGRQQK